MSKAFQGLPWLSGGHPQPSRKLRRHWQDLHAVIGWTSVNPRKRHGGAFQAHGRRLPSSFQGLMLSTSFPPPPEVTKRRRRWRCSARGRSISRRSGGGSTRTSSPRAAPARATRRCGRRPRLRSTTGRFSLCGCGGPALGICKESPGRPWFGP